jgi:hypothetical protein
MFAFSICQNGENGEIIIFPPHAEPNITYMFLTPLNPFSERVA